MGGQNERERIEIELTSSDPVPPEFVRGAPADALMATGRPEPAAANVRLVVTAAAVGVVALVLGWGLGRSGGGGSRPEQPVSSDNVNIERSDPVAAIATVPPTSLARVTTTITSTTEELADESPSPRVSASVQGAVDVAPQVVGQPMEIVAYGNGRQLFELDLMTSQLRSTAVAVQPFGPTRLLVAPDWVLIPSNDPELPSAVVRPDGSFYEVELGASWQVIGIADNGSIWWVIPTPIEGTGTVIQRRGMRGELLDEIAVLTEFPVGVDPAGGVIVELPGRVLGVRPQPAVTSSVTGAARVAAPEIDPITTGRVIALGDEIAVVEECAVDQTCGVFVVDRRSGARRELPQAPGATGGLVPYGPAGTPSVAPGGALAAVEVFDPVDRASSQRILGVMDLGTGVVVEVGPTQDIGQVAWSPDGRFLLHIDRGRIAAYDTDSAESIIIVAELVAIGSFGTRPLDR